MSETQIVTADELALAAKASCEVLPGYTLECRIGSGGFGEVWKASAPGGLEKAVKILYGQFDELQAEAELKSLERVRSLHHPFLLNIERIEIAAGRLVIVTELAEESLENRFAVCRNQGLPGIPYEELIGYLRDAADALDFMSSKHGLQHLDVKPDNLLLQSGHVKVADFGLTKDLSQSQVSLVGAFTPLFAPPELYSGQASASSDQYSLAVVYQKMLTGAPPFLGRTAAQLASQHLSSQPNLQPLPMSDRPAVARALSKNPDARFASCREFLDELVGRRSGEKERKPRIIAAPAEVPRQPQKTDPIFTPGSTEIVNPYIESQPFPLAGVDTSQAVFRPTFIVGLGGWAGQVLMELKRRLQTKFGPEARLPGLGVLYVDTDSQAVSRATRDFPGSLSYQETLAIPLRSPQDYKTHDVDFSDWLSRRWLYNIPRSRQVQGMRALGRLAFADHHDAVRQRIREHFTRLLSKEVCEIMREQTGLDYETGAPNVLVLASVSGGTGGGAVLDLGYLLQDELSAMALEGAGVAGLLMFATDFRESDRDVSVANGLCVLEELEHFSRASYPGDPTCLLPEISAAPFHNAYLIHLGEKLNENRLEERLAGVGEFLYREHFTSARAFFQEFQTAALEEAAENEVIHTFGFQYVDREPSDDERDQIQTLIRHLLARWTKPMSKVQSENVDASANFWFETTIETLGWKLNQILEQGIQAIRGGNGPKLQAFNSRCTSQIVLPKSRLSGQKKERFFEELVRGINREFDDQNPGEDEDHPRRWLEAFQSQLQDQVQGSRNTFEADFWTAVAGWPHPLAAAGAVADRAAQHWEDCRKQLSLVTQQLTSELAAFPARFQSCPLTGEDLKQFVAGYTDLRLCYETHQAILRFARSLQESLAEWSAKQDQIRAAFAQWLSIWSGESEPDAVEGQAEQEAARFDHELIRKGRRRLDLLAQSDGEKKEEWLRQLASEAQDFVIQSPANLSRPKDGENSFYASAAPHLQGVGGFHSVLLTAPSPDFQTHERLSQETFGDCVTVIEDPDEPIFLCCGTRNLKVSAVRNAISDQRQDLKEVATRLHTRIDVDWGNDS